MSSRPYPMIADLPSSVSVQNQLGTTLSINGLPDIAANATVVISLAAMSEARRVRRWLAIKGAVTAGKLAFTSPNALWGTLRVKNLTAALQVLGYGEPAFAANEVRDVDMVNRPLSQRFRIWAAVNAVGSGSLFSYVTTPSAGDPTVSAISPATADLAGVAVTITGEGFAPGATVTIGGVSCTSVVWVDDSHITCVAPVGTAGAKNVVVTNSPGHTGTLTNGFTYTAATFTSVTPNTGAAAGDEPVTIAGTNFKAGATVTIGGNPATDVVVTATSITCTTPAHAAGAVNVVVTNPGTGGSVATGTGAFTYA